MLKTLLVFYYNTIRKNTHPIPLLVTDFNPINSTCESIPVVIWEHISGKAVQVICFCFRQHLNIYQNEPIFKYGFLDFLFY